MDLNLSTIILEIINFLVLVWILHRFLYRPVLNIIDKRKHDIEEKLTLAKQSEAQAASLQQQYAQGLDNWHKEKQKLREEFNTRLESERKQRLTDLQDELAQLRESTARKQDLQFEEHRRAAEYQAIEQANQFSAKLLSKLACPALQEKLLDLLLSNLNNMDQAQAQTFKQHWQNQNPKVIKVLSAYPLNDSQKTQLQKAMNKAMDLDLPFEYRQQESLLAGLQVSVGSWVLAANLHDELRAFTDFNHVADEQ